jgi:hypothetical protein
MFLKHSPLARHLMTGAALLQVAGEASGATNGATPGAPSSPSTVEITIQGMSFEVDRPYAAGEHVLTAGEANALNQTRAENLRNNFASVVKKAMVDYRKANNMAEDAEVPVDKLDRDALEAEFDKYAAEYQFSERAGGGGPRTPKDPVEREANRIAWDKIKVSLGKKGIKIDSISAEKKAELIASALEKYPAITEEAQRRVNTAAEIALDDLNVNSAPVNQNVPAEQPQA